MLRLKLDKEQLALHQIKIAMIFAEIAGSNDIIKNHFLEVPISYYFIWNSG